MIRRWALILGTFAAVLWITFAPALVIGSDHARPSPAPPAVVVDTPPAPLPEACRCGKRTPLPMVTVVIESR